MCSKLTLLNFEHISHVFLITIVNDKNTRTMSLTFITIILFFFEQLNEQPKPKQTLSTTGFDINNKDIFWVIFGEKNNESFFGQRCINKVSTGLLGSCFHRLLKYVQD